MCRGAVVFAVLGFVALVAASCKDPPKTDSRIFGGALTASIAPFDTRCWTPDDYSECDTRSCTQDNNCCDKTKLGCMKKSCGSANNCDYELDPAEDKCQCVPGSCGPDGKSVCSCGVQDGQVVSSKMENCPPDYPTCDAGKRRCVCSKNAPHRCASANTYWQCNGDGQWGLATCPSSASTCDPNTGNCVCQKKCTGKECGPDGCGGFCATCPADHPTCNDQGKCVGCPPCPYGKNCVEGKCCDPNMGKSCIMSGVCGITQCDGSCQPKAGCAHPELCGKVCHGLPKCSFLNCDGVCDPDLQKCGNQECIQGGNCGPSY